MLLDLKKMNQTLDNMNLPNGTESKTESVQPKIDENDFFAAQSIERALLELRALVVEWKRTSQLHTQCEPSQKAISIVVDNRTVKSHVLDTNGPRKSSEKTMVGDTNGRRYEWSEKTIRNHGFMVSWSQRKPCFQRKPFL